MNKQYKASFYLLPTAIIWGIAFVVQEVASDSLPSATFNTIRMALAAVVLLMLTTWFEKKGLCMSLRKMNGFQKKAMLWGGVSCGIVLALACYAQQQGLQLGTGAGKTAFVTGLYIVLVPLVRFITGKGGTFRVWIAVGFCTVGLYLLCFRGNMTVSPVDLLLLAAAGCYTAQILLIDHFAPRTDSIWFSIVEYLSCALVNGIIALCTETPTWQGVGDCLLPILYVGLMSTAVGYTLQIVGQRDAEPTAAALIMSLECTFAVIAEWLMLGSTFTGQELMGCAFMATAVIITQIGGKSKVRE